MDEKVNLPYVPHPQYICPVGDVYFALVLQGYTIEIYCVDQDKDSYCVFNIWLGIWETVWRKKFSSVLSNDIYRVDQSFVDRYKKESKAFDKVCMPRL